MQDLMLNGDVQTKAVETHDLALTHEYLSKLLNLI